jgi:hypothetical protein
MCCSNGSSSRNSSNSYCGFATPAPAPAASDTSPAAAAAGGAEQGEPQDPQGHDAQGEGLQRQRRAKRWGRRLQHAVYSFLFLCICILGCAP